MHTKSLIGGVGDFARICSSTKKALAGLETNNRLGSGTYEKMRLSAAYINNLQNCISNLSAVIVSSILPVQRAVA